MELVRVLKATEQVVAGKLYSLTLEVKEAGEKKIYEAKVWVKPWINFRQLQEFKSVVPSFTVSDLGLKSGKSTVCVFLLFNVVDVTCSVLRQMGMDLSGDRYQQMTLKSKRQQNTR